LDPDHCEGNDVWMRRMEVQQRNRGASKDENSGMHGAMDKYMVAPDSPPLWSWC